MPDTRQLNRHEAAEIVGDNLDQVNEWLARGDGVAIYRNQALDSSGRGDVRLASFGSDAAQFPAEPPVQLPDFPGEINWMFRLIGTYQGVALEPPIPHEWAKPTTVLGLILDQMAGRVRDYTLHVNDPAGAMTNAVITMYVRATDLTTIHQVTISAFINGNGEVDRIGDFLWTIEGPGRRISDLSHNLGNCIVQVHNLTMDGQR